MDARELSARLPPPRDDEPASLRQDILDELADHLHCAMRREQLATGNTEAARQKVVEKFGDPAEVARKLWLQAMWSKIMSQRLMLAAMGLLTAACLALAGFTVWFMQQQRAAAAQQQQAMVEMIDRLVRQVESKGHSEGAGSVPAPTVSSIQLKLAIGTADGSPAMDHRVELRQVGFDKAKSTSERSDSDGLADFGYCDPGRYEISVRTPWNFGTAPKRFVLHPATAHVEHVICPPAPSDAQVSFVALLPEDLNRLGVQAIVQMESGALTLGEQVWREFGANRKLLVRHDSWDILSSSSETLKPDRTSGETVTYKWVISARRGEAAQHHIRAGPRYAVRGVRLVVPYTASSFDFRASGGTPGRVQEKRYEQIAPKPRTDPSVGAANEGPIHPLELEFVAEAGKLNEWVIPVPDELIEQARQYLTDHPPASESNE